MSIWHHLTSYKKITAPLIQEADPQGFWCSLDEGGLALHCWSLSLPVTGQKAPQCQQWGLPLVLLRSSTRSQGWHQRAVAPSQLGQATAALTNQPEIVFCSWSASIRSQRAGVAGDDLLCHSHVCVEAHEPPQGGARSAGPGGACLPWVRHPTTPGSLRVPWAAALAPDRGQHVVPSGLVPLEPKWPSSRPYSCLLYHHSEGGRSPRL